MYNEKIKEYIKGEKNRIDLGFDANRLDYIPEYFSSYLEQKRIPNFMCLVARHGEVAHYSHQGFKNIETMEKINEDSIFRIYSMTKPLTSVAIMMLYEKGMIRLEHELSRYLPEFKNTEVWDGGTVENYKTRPSKDPILIRDLLTHTSGLSYGFLWKVILDPLFIKNMVLKII